MSRYLCVHPYESISSMSSSPRLRPVATSCHHQLLSMDSLFSFQLWRSIDRIDSDFSRPTPSTENPCKAKSSALSGRIILREAETCFMFLINLSYRFVAVCKGRGRPEKDLGTYICVDIEQRLREDALKESATAPMGRPRRRCSILLNDRSGRSVNK